MGCCDNDDDEDDDDDDDDDITLILYTSLDINRYIYINNVSRTHARYNRLIYNTEYRACVTHLGNVSSKHSASYLNHVFSA